MSVIKILTAELLRLRQNSRANEGKEETNGQGANKGNQDEIHGGAGTGREFKTLHPRENEGMNGEGIEHFGGKQDERQGEYTGNL